VHGVVVTGRGLEIGQACLQRLGQIGYRLLCRRAGRRIELDPQPGLRDGGLLLIPVYDIKQPPVGIAQHAVLRMDQISNRPPLTGQHHRDGVNEPVLVVGDHRQHRVAARIPAVGVQRRGEQLDMGLPRKPPPGQLRVVQQRPGDQSCRACQQR